MLDAPTDLIRVRAGFGSGMLGVAAAGKRSRRDDLTLVGHGTR